MNKIFLVIGLLLASVSPVFAALPAVVGTTLTAVQTDGLALIDLIWPVVGAITGGFILFKLFKRGASKV
ncbi:MAG: hypothetical protein PHT07_24535 [Paludibacter sp.]|nr:hypothetical protein [Paludibacter sp.]